VLPVHLRDNTLPLKLSIINYQFSIKIPTFAARKRAVSFSDISHMAQKAVSCEARQQGVTNNKLFNAKS
jgi:hypothetical protein